jgi:hypothetical protein
MSADQIATPTDANDETGLADWLEATIVVEQRKHLPRARIRKYMKERLAGDDPDVTVDIVLQEIGRRQKVCRATYPFEEDGSRVVYTRSSAALPYLFMLAIATSRPYRDEHRQKDTDELFDTLVLDALKRYLGSGCQGVRFGSPASGKRPSNFRDAITWLAKQMKLPMGTGRARPTAGDGGLDVVVWRRFRDERNGYIVILAQCTVQTEWFGKARDLAEDVWRGWIDFGKDPHLVLAIPFAIPPNFAKWDDLRRTVHTVLDRLRLCELLDSAPLTRSLEAKKWLAAEITRMSR